MSYGKLPKVIAAGLKTRPLDIVLHNMEELDQQEQLESLQDIC